MPKFIAEVSSNHNRDLSRAYAFIDASARAGCDAVKFQLFRIDKLFAPEILERSASHRRRKDWELPLSFLPELAKYCQSVGIEFCCTPFYLDAVAEIEPYVDYFKIASYELLWDDLLISCAQSKKPIILSTGMATMPEIRHAVEILLGNGCSKLTLLHCTSAYPTPCRDANLAAIQTIRNETGCPVGWSDHTVEPGVIHRAVHRWGAEMIEFHLDLDGTGDEYAAGHCWLPGQITQVIRDVRSATISDGIGMKEPAPSELPDRLWRADPSDGLRPFRELRENWQPQS